MKAEKSIEILDRMYQESRKSLVKNSFFFILWGSLMALAGLIEFGLFGKPMYWLVWPIAGAIGGIIAFIYGSRQNKRTTAVHTSDRILKFTWSGFVLALIIAIVYSVSQKWSPVPLVLLFAAYATFITGGICKVNALLIGSAALALGAIASAFFIEANYHGIIFAISILIGYVYPGLMLRRVENE